MSGIGKVFSIKIRLGNLPSGAIVFAHPEGVHAEEPNLLVGPHVTGGKHMRLGDVEGIAVRETEGVVGHQRPVGTFAPFQQTALVFPDG
jgi:hypothetical protein